MASGSSSNAGNPEAIDLRNFTFSIDGVCDDWCYNDSDEEGALLGLIPPRMMLELVTRVENHEQDGNRCEEAREDDEDDDDDDDDDDDEEEEDDDDPTITIPDDVKEMNYSSDSKAKCPICFIRFKNSRLIWVLKCNHFFHKKCISSWIQNNPTCPLCRISV